MKSRSCYMKKIAHFQIPCDNNGNFLIDFETVNVFIKKLNEILQDDYYVVVSPFKPEYSEYLKEIPPDVAKDLPYDEWKDYVCYVM